MGVRIEASDIVVYQWVCDVCKMASDDFHNEEEAELMGRWHASTCKLGGDL